MIPFRPNQQNPMQNFMTQFNSFKQNITQQGLNPQMIVQNMLNNGQMTQSQFNQLSAMADSIMKS